jgi:hypothetical protein
MEPLDGKGDPDERKNLARDPVNNEPASRRASAPRRYCLPSVFVAASLARIFSKAPAETSLGQPPRSK